MEDVRDYAFAPNYRGRRGLELTLAMETEREKRPSLLAVISTVFWSFLGIRRRAAHESETVQLSPVQILVAGVLGAVLLVVALVALVRVIVASAG